MSTYKIIGKTNGWVASRDTMFNGKCEIILDHGLTLKQAQSKFIHFINEDYDKGFTNIGLAVAHGYAYKTSGCDGCYTYEYDSRFFSIEPEEDGE